MKDCSTIVVENHSINLETQEQYPTLIFANLISKSKYLKSNNKKLKSEICRPKSRIWNPNSKPRKLKHRTTQPSLQNGCPLYRIGLPTSAIGQQSPKLPFESNKCLLAGYILTIHSYFKCSNPKQNIAIINNAIAKKYYFKRHETVTCLKYHMRSSEDQNPESLRRIIRQETI